MLKRRALRLIGNVALWKWWSGWPGFTSSGQLGLKLLASGFVGVRMFLGRVLPGIDSRKALVVRVGWWDFDGDS